MDPEVFNLPPTTSGFGHIANEFGSYFRNVTAPILVRRSGQLVIHAFAYFSLEPLRQFQIQSAYLAWGIASISNPGGVLQVGVINEALSAPDATLFAAIGAAAPLAADLPVVGPQTTDLASVIDALQASAQAGGSIGLGWSYEFGAGTRQCTLDEPQLIIEAVPRSNLATMGSAAKFMFMAARRRRRRGRGRRR
ncbi:MAG TPA: hypothetical protein VJZ71_17730 [Phycisphaerae bacterium]|nr:hypothetical protein [Phycisphaerae bacterium]